jgi:hypothetical protein
LEEKKEEMKMNNVKIILNNDCDGKDVVLAYTMGFGVIPSMKELKSGTAISDYNHGLISVWKDKTITFKIQKNWDEIILLVPFFERFAKVLGGGEIQFSADKAQTAQTVPQNKIVQGLSLECVMANADDLMKFLNKPFDDKGFLKSSLTSTTEATYREIVKSIDKWYITQIPFDQSMKYFVFKANLENFILYALVNGANSLDEIKDKLQDYYNQYVLYLATKDVSIADAMKKGLKNIHKIA